MHPHLLFRSHTNELSHFVSLLMMRGADIFNFNANTLCGFNVRNHTDMRQFGICVVKEADEVGGRDLCVSVVI